MVGKMEFFLGEEVRIWCSLAYMVNVSPEGFRLIEVILF